jgi:hypothetical protein
MSPANTRAWVTSPTNTRRPAPEPPEPARYSWWSLARNPHALAVTGMVGAAMITDAMKHIALRVAFAGA